MANRVAKSSAPKNEAGIACDGEIEMRTFDQTCLPHVRDAGGFVEIWLREDMLSMTKVAAEWLHGQLEMVLTK